MVIVQPFALALGILVVAAVIGMPVDTIVGHLLSLLGQQTIGAIAGMADVFQLPITVPIYLARAHEPFFYIQQAASHDRGVWAATLVVWAIILRLLLAMPRPSGR